MQDNICRDKLRGTSQVVSKERVADHGEVFTAPREVNAMLDLVKSETERIESRFLEPACGTGNFMIEILSRKLDVVTRRYGKSQRDYELYSLCALSSIYGVELMEDNTEEARQRLLGAFSATYRKLFRDGCKEEVIHCAEFLLSRNVICGDALTMLTCSKPPKPITFSEWTFLPDGKVKRRDFTLSRLLAWTPSQERDLFSDLGDAACIPDPVAEYPLTHYLKLPNDGNTEQS